MSPTSLLLLLLVAFLPTLHQLPPNPSLPHRYTRLTPFLDMVLFRSATLQLTLSEDMVFVHPTQFEPDFLLPSTSRDPIIFGTALLSLPSRRAVSKIHVVFEGLTDASAGSSYPYETTTSLHKELELDLKGEVIEAGDHA